MAHGRKTGGRQLGTTNKATSTLQAQVEQAAGGEPLPVLLTRIGMLAMKSKDFQTAINALSKAAAFTYPRITAVNPPHDPVHLPAPSIVLNTPVVHFVDPEPCSECGHDPKKDRTRIASSDVGGPDRLPIQ